MPILQEYSADCKVFFDEMQKKFYATKMPYILGYSGRPQHNIRRRDKTQVRPRPTQGAFYSSSGSVSTRSL